ncbi:HAMP domain-containing sensor histidine kinase [Ruegeria atlantica]|uniref:HAMP domain-containing sensor histidine kinase n=1 Tax=Ruegeria atlantica TaxID=81569 RepID=UPI00147DD08F|nr:HAMP domain-containing sensor histidine kinase [Ruegeria atlantica]
MKRSNIVSGAAFTTALYAAVVILLSVTALAFLTFERIRGDLQREMDSLLIDEMRFIQEILDDNDNDSDVVQAIDDATLWLPFDTSLIGLFDNQGKRLAGNIDEYPSFRGWGEIEDDGIDLGGEKRVHRVNVQTYRGFVIVVGRDLAFVKSTLRSLTWSLVAIGFGATLCTLLVGYISSIRTYRKLGQMAKTLNKVSRGDVKARLSVGKNNDQIDRIARLMNGHLDNLTALMSTTRSTAASIAHDLKNPLTHAYIALQEARDTLQSDGQPLELIDNIQSELDRLKWTFETVLRINRIEEGNSPKAFSYLDLNRLGREAVETMIPLAEAKGQSLNFVENQSGSTLIEGDEGMLKQLCANLLQNSIDHCPKHSRVRLLIEQEDGIVTLSVLDDGPGVPENTLGKLFVPFYKLESERNSVGNGLGLALVKAIADHHSALIAAKNNSPGLTVSVRFNVA